MKKKPKSRELLMLKVGDTTSSVICPHHPTCENSEACIKRTMEYAMGKRLTP